MPARHCMYCDQPVYDGTGYHPECVPKPGHSGERVRAAAFPAPARTAASVLAEDRGYPVRVIDIDMRFMSMVTFMVKWAIAAIPAFIILTAFWLVILLFLGGVIRGLSMR